MQHHHLIQISCIRLSHWSVGRDTYVTPQIEYALTNGEDFCTKVALILDFMRPELKTAENTEAPASQ